MTDEIAKKSPVEKVDRADARAAAVGSRDHFLNEVHAASYKTNNSQFSDTASTRAQLPSLAIIDENHSPRHAAATLSRDGTQESRTSIMHPDWKPDVTQPKSPISPEVTGHLPGPIYRADKDRALSRAEVSTLSKKRLDEGIVSVPHEPQSEMAKARPEDQALGKVLNSADLSEKVKTRSKDQDRGKVLNSADLSVTGRVPPVLHLSDKGKEIG